MLISTFNIYDYQSFVDQNDKAISLSGPDLGFFDSDDSLFLPKYQDVLLEKITEFDTLLIPFDPSIIKFLSEHKLEVLILRPKEDEIHKIIDNLFKEEEIETELEKEFLRNKLVDYIKDSLLEIDKVTKLPFVEVKIMSINHPISDILNLNKRSCVNDYFSS